MKDTKFMKSDWVTYGVTLSIHIAFYMLYLLLLQLSVCYMEIG